MNQTIFWKAAVVLLVAVVPSVATARGHRSANPIQHVVIVVQEARSFDNLFCGYKGSDGVCGRHNIPLEAACTLSDSFKDFQRDVRTGAFGHEKAMCDDIGRPEYAHVPVNEIHPYIAIAGNYALADHMFSSTGNPAFEAHQYLLAAQTGNARDMPFGSAAGDGCFYQQMIHMLSGPAGPACFTYQTLTNELGAVGLTWAYYRANVHNNTSDALGWLNGTASGDGSITPETRFLTDVGNGILANVTWVTPSDANSDRSGSQSATGPAWVAAVVNAVGESQFWNSTVVFVTWSGFGGWADHVPPPALDSQGLGFRVPLLTVSAYARSGYVSHVQYEHGSILKFIENRFGLSPLAASDSRASDPASDMFDFNAQPRPFVPIPTH